METIEKLFNTYGFQSASVIAILSFFCQRFFNIRDKKIELKRNLFQNLKVESINNFIDCYSSSELCWVQIPYYDILNAKISAHELDDLVMPTYNRFMSSYYKLFVILDEKEMKEFTEIVESISIIKSSLNNLIQFPKRKNASEWASDYFASVADMERKNRSLLRIIGENFRCNYN